jgi:hypothetical protein
MANSQKGVRYCCGLPKNVATLLGDAQDQSLYEKHLFEIFQNPTKGLNEATKMV